MSWPRARQTGWELMQTPDGAIIQSGSYRRPGNSHHDVSNTMGWMTRAVVLATYYGDDGEARGWAGKTRAVYCDVRTYGRYTRFLSRVLVLQEGHGLWDTDFRVPRPSRSTLSGGDVVSQPSGDKVPTPAEDLDGDHVLVGFLDNDPHQPVVLPFVMAHPNSRYEPKAADGRVRRIRHNGTLIEIDKEGNVTLDGRGSAAEEFSAGGAEQSNSGTGGKVLLVTKDGSGNVTSVYLNNQGQIHFGGAPGTATEPFVCGNVLKSIMGDLRTAVRNLKLMTAWGPTIGQPLNLAEFEAVFARFDADEHSSDFIFGKKTY